MLFSDFMWQSFNGDAGDGHSDGHSDGRPTLAIFSLTGCSKMAKRRQGAGTTAEPYLKNQ